MRSILEKAIVHLLNEEQDKADALFHQFVVERSRQIHEALRQDDDALEGNDWEKEITAESYFTEADLSDLEDTEAEGDVGGEGDFGAEGGEVDAAADGLGDDLGGEEVGGEMDAMDGGADEFGGAEGDVETRVSDLEDQLEALTAEFEQLMAEIDPDADGDHDSEDHDFGGEADAGAEGGEDFGGEDEGEPEADADAEGESEAGDEEDFDDITESVLSELEKISVSLTDGREIGASGKTIGGNNTSPALSKKPSERQAGEPVRVKSTNHQGFERETAPSVKDSKPRKNTLRTANSALSRVSKEGDKSAELNKLKSDGNNVSPVLTRK